MPYRREENQLNINQILQAVEKKERVSYRRRREQQEKKDESFIMNRNPDNLNSYISRSGWYSLAYPEHWQVDEEDECTTIYKLDDGVGALQISAFETDIPQSARESLLEYLKDENIEAEIQSKTVGKRNFATCSYIVDDSYSKLWFITTVNFLLFITYTCDVTTVGTEREEIDKIIQSLQIAV